MKKLLDYRLLLLCTAICGLVFSGCAKYKPHQFTTTQHHQRKQLDHALLKKQTSSVSAREVSNSQSRFYFGRSINNKARVIPILITVDNPTSQSLALDAWDIDLPIMHTETVLRATNFKPVQRMIAWSALGLFVPIFFIPAIVDGMMAIDANRAMEDDFYERTISTDSYIKIAPYTTIQRIIFIKASEKRHIFTLKLTHRKTGVKESHTITLM